MRIRRGLRALAAIVACSLIAPWSFSQEKDKSAPKAAAKTGDSNEKEPKNEPKDKNQKAEPNDGLTPEERFWFDGPRQRAATAAQLVAAQNPLTIAAMRFKTRLEQVFGDLEATSDFAPLLDARLLDEIRDGRELKGLEGRIDQKLPRADQAMYHAYSQAVINAASQPPEVFKRSAQDNDFIKFAQLWTDPRGNRGKVVVVTGRLVRIRKFEPPVLARQEGIRYIYEGWLFGETKGAHPYAIIFIDLPDGFRVTEEMNKKVTFYGYFLGKVKLRAPKGDLEYPLVIGPTFYPAPGAVESPDDEFPPWLVGLSVILILMGLVSLVVAIRWWFKKGDEEIQAKLAARQAQQVMEAMSAVEGNAEPGVTPPTETPPETGITAERPNPTGPL